MSEKLNEIDANEITERDNLAVVYRVEKLEPIPNKDRIELVHLTNCGYAAICEKGHNVGDLVVFVKYDTIVPNNELFDFMKESKFRVKPKSFTIRDDNNEVIDKIYSQGIVLPIVKMYEQLRSEQIYDVWDIPEGTDVTQLLKVKKYISPVQGSGSSFGQMRSKGDFPTHIVSKTDEVNVCSKMKALEEIQGLPVYITQKIEGSSITFFMEDDELVVCSRNNILAEVDNNKFWQAVAKNDIKNKLKNHKNYVFQAELYGVGITKNKLGIPDVDIAIFNVSVKVTKQRLGFYEMDELLKTIKLPMVPVCCIVNSYDWTFEKLQKFADIQKYANGEVAEGIVIRPMIPFYSKYLKDIWSVKCINRDYKL